MCDRSVALRASTEGHRSDCICTTPHPRMIYIEAECTKSWVLCVCDWWYLVFLTGTSLTSKQYNTWTHSMPRAPSSQERMVCFNLTSWLCYPLCVARTEFETLKVHPKEAFKQLCSGAFACETASSVSASSLAWNANTAGNPFTLQFCVHKSNMTLFVWFKTASDVKLKQSMCLRINKTQDRLPAMYSLLLAMPQCHQCFAK